MIHLAYRAMLGIAHKFRYNVLPFLLRDTVQMRTKTAICLRLPPVPLPYQDDLLSFKSGLTAQQTTSNDDTQPLMSEAQQIKVDDYPLKRSAITASGSKQLYGTGFKSKQAGAASWILALFAAAILLTVIVGLALGHSLGYKRGYHALEVQNKQAINSTQMTVQELEEMRASYKKLSNQVAVAKQELTISLNNLDELRENQKELSLENKQLNQLNEVYAAALSEEGGLPLQVLGAKIEPLPENAFEFGFDIAMLSEDGQAKRLNATLMLLNDDDFVEVPLDSASYLLKGITRIRGRFVMPNNFEPLQVKLVLTADDQEVEQLYDWTLGDRVDSMPLSLIDLPEVDQSPI